MELLGIIKDLHFLKWKHWAGILLTEQTDHGLYPVKGTPTCSLEIGTDFLVIELLSKSISEVTLHRQQYIFDHNYKENRLNLHIMFSKTYSKQRWRMVYRMKVRNVL